MQGGELAPRLQAQVVMLMSLRGVCKMQYFPR
jgi:hypothetical protein